MTVKTLAKNQKDENVLKLIKKKSIMISFYKRERELLILVYMSTIYFWSSFTQRKK